MPQLDKLEAHIIADNPRAMKRALQEFERKKEMFLVNHYRFGGLSDSEDDYDTDPDPDPNCDELEEPQVRGLLSTLLSTLLAPHSDDSHEHFPGPVHLELLQCYCRPRLPKPC
jgi:hypothetical protein